MRIMRIIVTLILLPFTCSVALSQTKPPPAPKPTPDFSGTWKLEKEEVVLSPDNSGFTSASKKGANVEASTVIITITGPMLHEKETGTEDGKPYMNERTYYTDGRGESVPSRDDPDLVIVTKTGMNKRTLTIDGLFRLKNNPRKQVGSPFKHEWKVSEDNQTLVMTSCQHLREFGNGRPLPHPMDLCLIGRYRRSKSLGKTRRIEKTTSYRES